MWRVDRVCGLCDEHPVAGGGSAPPRGRVSGLCAPTRARLHTLRAVKPGACPSSASRLRTTWVRAGKEAGGGVNAARASEKRARATRDRDRRGRNKRGACAERRAPQRAYTCVLPHGLTAVCTVRGVAALQHTTERGRAEIRARPERATLAASPELSLPPPAARHTCLAILTPGRGYPRLHRAPQARTCSHPCTAGHIPTLRLSHLIRTRGVAATSATTLTGCQTTHQPQ